MWPFTISASSSSCTTPGAAARPCLALSSAAWSGEASHHPGTRKEPRGLSTITGGVGRGTLGSGVRFANCSTLPSVKFDAGLASACEAATDGLERHPPPTMQGGLMHPVQGTVHKTREVAFDEQSLALEKTHQVPDRAVISKRYK